MGSILLDYKKRRRGIGMRELYLKGYESVRVDYSCFEFIHAFTNFAISIFKFRLPQDFGFILFLD